MSDTLIDVTWNGPFVADIPGRGHVAPGEIIQIPAHQAKDNPWYQPVKAVHKPRTESES